MSTFSFPSGIRCLVATVRQASENRFPESELSCVAGAVRQRREEFKAGRHLARLLMRELGVNCNALLVGEDRLPRWPEGVTGSITHSRDLVGVALSRSCDVRSVGLDLEKENTAEDSLLPLLASDEEMENLLEGREDLTRLFSCKEAVFKAVFALHREYFEFRDIRLKMSDETFTAVCTRGNLVSAQNVAMGQGYVTRYCGHIMSLFVVPAVSPVSLCTTADSG